ncbi:MAG: glycosyltransferase family 2 protein [Planctomycetaceae bacterium]|nr:glycosyltransferase family 2 protein [Planctomycetaceae bacterium]
MIKLSVCCCTYNRPHLLGELIASFQMQTYPKDCCELIVLDDAGQYGDLRGDNWQVVSFPRRFVSLGEKRNACVSLTSPDFTHIVIADDDDIYLPWWLECHAKNFERGAKWSFASSIFWSVQNRIVNQWQHHDEEWIMHPAHAFEKKTFWDCDGYPHLAWKEDREFFERLRQAGIEHEDSLSCLEEHRRIPYLIHRRNMRWKHRHTTGLPLEEYQRFEPELPKAILEIGWKKDYLSEARNYMEQRHSLKENHADGNV